MVSQRNLGTEIILILPELKQEMEIGKRKIIRSIPNGPLWQPVEETYFYNK